jgi:hypothetical protein
LNLNGSCCLHERVFTVLGVVATATTGPEFAREADTRVSRIAADGRVHSALVPAKRAATTQDNSCEFQDAFQDRVRIGMDRWEQNMQPLVDVPPHLESAWSWPSSWSWQSRVMR